jgi:hypothetical protein
VDTKGCVALHWEKSKTIDGRVCWKVAYKVKKVIPMFKNYINSKIINLNLQRWFYSSAIESIKRWRFSSKEGAVAEHMKTCPYNLRSPHKPVDEVVKRYFLKTVIYINNSLEYFFFVILVGRNLFQV